MIARINFSAIDIAGASPVGVGAGMSGTLTSRKKPGHTCMDADDDNILGG